MVPPFDMAMSGTEDTAMSPEAMEVLDGIEPLIALNIGPMFSSKTELAFYFAGRYLERGISVVFVKPSWDTRYGDPAVLRSQSRVIQPPSDLPVVVVDRGQEQTIPELAKHYEVTIIDEGQAFRPPLAVQVRSMYQRGQRVIVNLLNFTWELRQFATTSACLGLTEPVVFRKSSFCRLDGCKRAAVYSQKLLPNGQPARVFSGEVVDDPGGQEKYTARCWDHWLATTPGAREEYGSPNSRFFTVDPDTNWAWETAG